jgi:hypothetical protein
MPGKKAGKTAKPVWMATSFFRPEHHFRRLHHLFRSMIGKMAAAFFSHFLKIARLKSGDGEI